MVHTCDRPLEPGSQVEGDIDWSRRFDLMQHHSGEHIVSGIAHARYGCENVGFHMGSDVITIDLSVELTQEQIQELEEAANRYIWEDHPIQIAFPSPQELEVLEYRSKKALTGRVRIVSFPGADTCACCGTHVSSSGQVGLVKLLSCQKFRSGVRIELVCGKRALDHLSRVWEQNHQISNLLSAKTGETRRAVARLLEENQALKGRLSAMEDARFAALAGQYRDAGDLLLFEEGLSPDGLRLAGRGSAGDLRRAVCLLLRSGRLGLPLCHRPGGRGPAGADPCPEPGPVRAGRRQAGLRPGLRSGGADRHPGLFRRPLIPLSPIWKGSFMEYTLYQLLWFFLIYAFLGWLMETALAAVRKRRLLNRGFLNAPFSPVYGLAAVLFAIFLPELRSAPLLSVSGRHDPGHRPGAGHRTAAGASPTRSGGTILRNHGISTDISA